MSTAKATDSNIAVKTAPPEFASKFRQILIENGITTPVSEVILKHSGLHAENFTSFANYVTINFIKESREPPLNLFIKRTLIDESEDPFKDDCKLFTKEVTFFTKFLPAARKYCQSKGLEEFLEIYPKCYYGDKDLIVFENLVLDKGYFLVDKIKKQDFETARVALSNLAKHHALTHSMIIEEGGLQKFLRKYPHFDLPALLQPSSMSWMQPLVDNGIMANIELLKKSDHPKSQEIIEILEGFKGDRFYKTLEKLMSNPSDNPFCTILHGDYWNNNMMFLNDLSTGKIVKQIQVDFQLVYYGSPCLDLAYYFYTSLPPQLRRERLGELLKIYYDSLISFTDLLGHSIQLTFEQFKKNYCKNFEASFIYGTFISSEMNNEIMMGAEDVKECDGLGWVVGKILGMTKQWLENHPEKREKFVGDIIDQFEEYEKLKNEVI